MGILVGIAFGLGIIVLLIAGQPLLALVAAIVGGIVAIRVGTAERRGVRILDSQPPSAPEPTKTCPRCAETVKAAAVVCRYCGHEFAPED